MSLPAVTASRVPPTTPRAMQAVARIEEQLQRYPAPTPKTVHVLHGGIYSRTITIPGGHALTGVLVKVPTTLIVCGNCTVLLGDGEEHNLTGYHVLAASAGRRQAYIAHTDTHLTMLLPTKAKTVEDAEREFTDETDRLLSRQAENEIVITGE